MYKRQVEPFGNAGRDASSPFAYWLVRGSEAGERPELALFTQWVIEQAAQSRQAIGET